MSIRVLIVDDHAVVREGLRAVVAGDGELAVMAEAPTAQDALAAVKREAPDVILLDISMPQMSGLDAVPLLLAAAPGARILMLSVHDDAEYVMKAVKAGAHGYVRKDTTPAELRGAIRAVHGGAGFFSPAVAGKLAEAIRTRDEGPRAGIGVLTAREREILGAIARGLLNKEIAAELRISIRTVEAHRDNLMRKLGVRSAAALTRLAIEEGLL